MDQKSAALVAVAPCDGEGRIISGRSDTTLMAVVPIIKIKFRGGCCSVRRVGIIFGWIDGGRENNIWLV